MMGRFSSTSFDRVDCSFVGTERSLDAFTCLGRLEGGVEVAVGQRPNQYLQKCDSESFIIIGLLG